MVICCIAKLGLLIATTQFPDFYITAYYGDDGPRLPVFRRMPASSLVRALHNCDPRDARRKIYRESSWPATKRLRLVSNAYALFSGNVTYTTSPLWFKGSDDLAWIGVNGWLASGGGIGLETEIDHMFR